MPDLTPEAWIEILLYDVMLSLPVPITQAEYERQMASVFSIMEES